MVDRITNARNAFWDDGPKHSSILVRGELAMWNDPIAAKVFKRQQGITVKGMSKIMPDHFKEPFESDEERDNHVMKLAIRDLNKLLRYELRAINQRDKAIAKLDLGIGICF